MPIGMINLQVTSLCLYYAPVWKLCCDRVIVDRNFQTLGLQERAALNVPKDLVITLTL